MSGYGGYGTKPKIPGYNLVATPTMDPQTASYRSDVLDASRSGFTEGTRRMAARAAGDTSEFEAIEKPAFENFNRLLGQIGSRYAGVGSGQMSARNSSAFQNETTGAAGDLAAQLQEQRLGMQDRAYEQLRGIYGDMMSHSPYEYGLNPKKKKWQQVLAEMLGNMGGQAPGMFSFTKAL